MGGKQNFSLQIRFIKCFISPFIAQVCVAAIAQTECILALKKCMENERDLIATCCETLTRLFKCQHVSGLFFKIFPTIFPAFIQDTFYITEFAAASR